MERTASGASRRLRATWLQRLSTVYSMTVASPSTPARTFSSYPECGRSARGFCWGFRETGKRVGMGRARNASETPGPGPSVRLPGRCGARRLTPCERPSPGAKRALSAEPTTMADPIPRTVTRELQFENGKAIGISNRWEKGQYCSILTPAGIVGCGIYDLETPAEFDQAIAIARGTPACPLVEPEDLFDARIVGVTPKAASYGIRVGMTGREAVELLLQASRPGATSPEPGAQPASTPAIQVKSIDHVTLVVKDLERSRKFYVEALGMREVPRPAFSFAGSWFQAGKTQIHLILEYSGSGPAGNLLPEQLRS